MSHIIFLFTELELRKLGRCAALRARQRQMDRQLAAAITPSRPRSQLADALQKASAAPWLQSASQRPQLLQMRRRAKQPTDTENLAVVFVEPTQSDETASSTPQAMKSTNQLFTTNKEQPATAHARNVQRLRPEERRVRRPVKQSPASSSIASQQADDGLWNSADSHDHERYILHKFETVRLLQGKQTDRSSLGRFFDILSVQQHNNDNDHARLQIMMNAARLSRSEAESMANVSVDSLRHFDTEDPSPTTLNVSPPAAPV